MPDLPPLCDGRCHYVSEISPETDKLWTQVEANRQAFLRECPPEQAEKIYQSTDFFSKQNLIGLSSEAIAHIRFCRAVR